MKAGDRFALAGVEWLIHAVGVTGRVFAVNETGEARMFSPDEIAEMKRMAAIPVEHFCKGGCGKRTLYPSAICAECIDAVTTRVSAQAAQAAHRAQNADLHHVKTVANRVAREMVAPSPYDAERARLADECGRLRDENRALLVENAELRRKVERLERRGRR